MVPFERGLVSSYKISDELLSWLQESQVSSLQMTPRPPPPSEVDPGAKKPRNWTRLRFKKTRRHLDPVATDANGYPSASRSSVANVDAKSTLSDNSGLPIEQSHVMANKDDDFKIADRDVLSY